MKIKIWNLKVEPEINILLFPNILADDNATDDKVGWWKEEHFNASDMDGNGLLNLTEFNEYVLCSCTHPDLHAIFLFCLFF